MSAHASTNASPLRGGLRCRNRQTGHRAGRLLPAAERTEGGHQRKPRRSHSHGGGLLRRRISRGAERAHRLRPSLRAHDVSRLGQREEDGARKDRRSQRRGSPPLRTPRLSAIFSGAAPPPPGGRAVGRGRRPTPPPTERGGSEEPEEEAR